MKHSLLERAAKIRFFVTDVDGVLTDGSLYFSNEGEDLKAFNVRDGLGIKWLQDAGISTAIITGRTSNIVLNRAKGLGISHVIQGRRSEEHTSELQSRPHLVCRLLLEKKKQKKKK